MTLMAPRERGRPVGPVVAEGLAFLSQTLDHALAYWDQIRGTASMPRRDTLVPEEIVALWPHILMVDVLDEGTDYHFRLVGQRLVDTYGEQTGRKLSNAAISEVVRARCRQIFDFCRAHGAPTYAYWSESASDRRPLIDVEALCLPLSSDGSALDRMISLNVNSRRHG
ncbi:MAG TPA: PAS domain-containing protein [Kiloniellaceae bacterium]